MSELANEIIKQLFTDWNGKPVPRLIQEGTGRAGWSENAVRAVIKAAELTQSKRAEKASSRVRKNKKVLPA